MRITAIIAFVAAVHIGSASIDAQQPSMEWRPKANSFGNLFTPPGKPPSPPRFLFPTPTPKFNQPPDARRASKPAVVCGLTLIPGDPNVDPAIGRELPENGPRYAIRSVDPKFCRQP